ncbi:unnamed protein product [Lactuca saligna]|uniref:SWIM-type domain-containing protein n=1 Tax=Lactuca saligna TaxID=75948 RepID=A0AA35YJS4_LACSI|nr:unnamed protein product [Lactuca saligna]
MNITMWHVRLLNTPFNPKVVYDGHPTLFTIKLYHEGEFTKYPEVHYIDGTVNYVDMVDIDEFSVHELDAIMKGFRYGVPPIIYYHFLVPGGDFHFGLRPLGNDQDVANFSQYVSEHKVMKVYTEHGETRLLTYFLNPKPVTKVTLVQLDEPHEDVQHIDEAPDDQSKETPVMTTPTDNLVDVVPTQANQPEIQVNEIVQVVSLSPGYNRRRGMSKDFVEAATDFDIGLYQQILQSNVDGVNGTNMHDVNEPQMDEENQAQMDEENQPKMNDFWDFDYQTDAFVQDGSENQPQSNMDSSGKENVSEVESKERSETEQEDDSDYWVDEDNVIEDIEVDMRDFNMSIDTEVEFLDKRARNPRQHESDEEADELDVIDNDAFDSMDEDSDQDKKRRAVLKQLSKEKSCSLGEVHKCHFKIGQKYNSKQELKEKIKMHALETKKNIAFKKNEKSRLRAICNGVVAFTNDGVGGPTQAEKSKGKIKGKSKGKSKEKDKQGGTSQEKTDSSCPWMLHASRSTDASSCLYDKSAYEWLKSIPPQHWARSHFTGRATTDMLLNNLCEVFNGKLVDGRDKPIISCLEFIREYMMKRICNVLKVQQKCLGPLTPTATKIMEKNEAAATQYIAEWCGDEKYQVKGPWNDQHVVDMHERVCSCRKWELTCIPCRHVISVLYNKADHGECVQELHTYVHKVHWLQTWKTAYGYKVEPIKGRALWPRSECPMQITPPPHRNQPRRPKRKRRQSMEEKSQSKSQSQSQGLDVGPSEIHGHGPHGSGKLTRKFVSVTCSKCGNKGHNSRTCKGQGGT